MPDAVDGAGRARAGARVGGDQLVGPVVGLVATFEVGPRAALLRCGVALVLRLAAHGGDPSRSGAGRGCHGSGACGRHLAERTMPTLAGA